MANTTVNHVQKSDGTTVIDIRDTTAVASDVAEGKYFYTAAGVRTAGTSSGSAVIGVQDETDSHGGTIRHITGVSLQGDTVTAATLLDGITAHDAGGNPITGTYSAPTARTASDVTVSGATVTIPAGAYASEVTKSVASGSAGTPTATKGSVRNHAVTVTPSVTNTTGYITGSTKTGTAVSVSASELVSGTLSVTANGTGIDVTNYAAVDVAVPSSGGGGMNVQAYIGYDSVASTSYTATDLTLTVAVTGTYNVSWVGWRTTTSGTSGTYLYVNGSARGSATTSFTGSYGQNVKQTGVSLNAGDVVVVRARSRSTSYYMYVANLVIEQTA